MEKYGVIDLGTNTFHLLIVSVTHDRQLKELVRRRVFVKLAENGIKKIGTNPYQRGLKVLQTFQELLIKHNVKDVKALGTAALRTASNGMDFIKEVHQTIGIPIDVISGDQEAALIHQGVMHAVDLGKDKGVIMDIGGGSVEFIIADEQKVYWAKSFPIGVAVLYNQFHKNDPISQNEINDLTTYLQKTLKPVVEMLDKHAIKHLIGASGTFDVLEDFLAKEKLNANSTLVPANSFPEFYQSLIQSTLSDRIKMERLPDSRAELIIVALVLIDFILQNSSINKIIVSDYAMKEGMLYQMIEKV